MLSGVNPGCAEFPKKTLLIVVAGYFTGWMSFLIKSIRVLKETEFCMPYNNIIYEQAQQNCKMHESASIRDAVFKSA